MCTPPLGTLTCYIKDEGGIILCSILARKNEEEASSIYSSLQRESHAIRKFHDSRVRCDVQGSGSYVASGSRVLYAVRATGFYPFAAVKIVNSNMIQSQQTFTANKVKTCLPQFILGARLTIGEK